MADDEVNPLTTATTNYGFVKPDIGASDDVWGGLLNTDLDGIDSAIKSVSTVANAAYPASNPSGYQTATQVTAAVPVASSTTPLMDGTAAVGTGTTWARADHVHPTDTSGWLGDNRIINGDMRIDQRNNGASGTVNGYTIDRWIYNGSQISKGVWARNAAGPLGFPYSLFFQSSSAYSVIAADAFQFGQPIEADMISDFSWGATGAQPVTLSFWAYSTLNGTFSGSVCNYAGTRSYPFSYSLPTASTWTKIVITIPGDTTGTWVLSGNAGAMYLRFDLGSGVNNRGPANAWASANYIGVTGSVSVVGTNSAVFVVTGVKLEIGSVATPFNRYSLAKSMADCQRYYQAGTFTQGGYGGGSGSQYMQVFQVGMRAAPTVTPQFNTQTNCGSSAINLISVFSFAPYTVVGAVGGFLLTGNFTASAEL